MTEMVVVEVAMTAVTAVVVVTAEVDTNLETDSHPHAGSVADLSKDGGSPFRTCLKVAAGRYDNHTPRFRSSYSIKKKKVPLSLLYGHSLASRLFRLPLLDPHAGSSSLGAVHSITLDSLGCLWS
jgi:hypothetical protein